MSEQDESMPVDAVNLTKEVYVEGGDFELLCCQVGNAMAANWVSAAEIVYEITGQPGSVVRNTISFESEPRCIIEINLLSGSFVISREGNVVGRGRKGIELLMEWQSFSFNRALEWVCEKYSVDKARAMGIDYVNMTLATMSSAPTEKG